MYRLCYTWFMKLVAFRFSTSMIRKLKKISKESGVPVSDIVRRAVAQALKVR